MKAIDYRETYKPILKGLVCHLCSQDTIISWNNQENMSPVINSCCEEFDKKVKTKLGMKK